MKKKKQTIKVNFICDECKEESGYICETGSDDFSGEHPFPYKDGWIYVHTMLIKIFGGDIEIKEKHFCNQYCLDNHISALRRKLNKNE